jgi:4-amino-4-deoxy-L-arabinose transferase
VYTPQQHTLAVRVLIAIALASCVLSLLPGLGKQVVVRQQELRVALTARNMVQGGNWLIPHFQGHTRLRKPPVMYWVVALVYDATKSTTSAFVTRFPSVVFGTLLILVIGRRGRRLTGDRQAFLGALVAFSTFVFQRFTRLAETDIPLVLMTSLSAFYCYEAVSCRRPVRHWVGAGLFAGIGFMIKGPAAVVMPALAVTTFIISTPDRRKVFRWWHPMVAFLVFLAVALPWYAWVTTSSSAQTAADKAINFEISALLTSGRHGGPWYYYIYKLPVLMLPWGPLLPIALYAAWRRRRRDEGIHFVVCWFLSSFVVLSLLYNKQSQYALLLLPSASLLLGAFFSDALARPGSRSCKLIVGYNLFLGVFLAVSAFALLVAPFFERLIPRAGACALGLLMLTVSSASWLRCLRRRTAIQFGVLALGMLILVQSYIFLVHPVHRPESLIPSYIQRVAPRLKDSQTIWLVGSRKASWEFYAGRPVTRAATLRQAWTSASVNDAIIALWRTGHPLDVSCVPAEPVSSTNRGNLHGACFIKQP